MRDINRIPPTMRTLEWLWREFPDMRLGQLLLNALPEDRDLYQIEDDELVLLVTRFVENN